MEFRPFTASDICAHAGVTPVTLRAWRNRNGLLRGRGGTGKWNRYSFRDLITVYIVAMMTRRHFEAQAAIDLVEGPMHEEIRKAANGVGRKVGIAYAPPDFSQLECREIEEASYENAPLGWFQDEMVIVVDLRTIGNKLYFATMLNSEDD